MINADKMESNWETYKKLLLKACGETSQLQNLLDCLGERIVMCPSNMKEEYGGAYPGGMVEHALSVTMKMRKLSQALGWNIGGFQVMN